MSQETVQFYFDDNFQLGIFELMMADTNFCQKSTSLLKAEYFKNQYYAFFFEKIRELVNIYNSTPTHLQIRNEVMKFAPEKREIYLKIYERIIKPTMIRDHAYIRNNLAEFCQKGLRLQLNEILLKNQNKTSEYVNDLIKKKVEEISSINFGNTTCQSLGQLTTILEKSAQDCQRLIPTFLPTIDRALGGGIPRQTMTFVLGGTNAGKSIFIINWIYHLILAGYKVLLVNLEGHENQAMVRLASRAIGAFQEDVRHNRLNDIELRKKLEFEEKYKNSIQIFHSKKFGFTIEDLIAIATQKKEEFNYDVLFVDYGQIVKSKRKYSELRHEQAEVHRELSNIASVLDCAVITPGQGTRETQEKNSKGKGLLRMTDVSECFEIMRASATVLTLNRSDSDIASHTARILLDKSRDGLVNVLETVKTNFRRCAFYGPAEEGLGYISQDDYLKLHGVANG
jgi:replicative DNA helicase